jgi:threonyl-tRNA synthetase
MVIIGDKEAEANLLAIRSRSEGDLGTMDYDAFLNKIKQEITEKVIK